MLNDEIVKRLKDNSDWQAFQFWVVEKIDELKIFDGVQSMSDTEAGQEVRAREKAALKLVEILEPFVSYREVKEKTEKEKAEAKKKFGL
jgi:hypothetical protein